MRAATLELPCDIRVHVVSPPWDIETLMALKAELEKMREQVQNVE